MTKQSLGIVLLLALFANGASFAAEPVATPPMVGTWEGNGRIIVIWCQQTNLPIRLEICVDGSVTGKVGDAMLTNGRLKQNRGWFGRKLRVKTDYIIVGDLTGPIVAAEGITRSGLKMPLNFNGRNFVGGLHTTGCKFGGKKHMILSAASLTLQRTN